MGIWIIPLALLILFEGIADIFSQSWADSGKFLYWGLAIVAYIVGNIFWLFALRNGSGLARGGSIFSITSVVLAILIGVFIFKESITLREGIGIALGVIAIGLIVWE